MNQIGLDSLMHMELRNKVNGELEVNIPIGEFASSPTISDLAEVLLSNLAVTSVLQSGKDDEMSGTEMEEFTL